MVADRQWEQTQQQRRATMQRENFGLAVPLRQSMETKLASEVS